MKEMIYHRYRPLPEGNEYGDDRGVSGQGMGSVGQPHEVDTHVSQADLPIGYKFYPALGRQDFQSIL